MNRRGCPRVWCRISGTPSAKVQNKAESFQVGTWLSLVEHSLGVRGVGSSNLPVPTNQQLADSFLYSVTEKVTRPEDTVLAKFEQFIRERQYLSNVSPATVAWHTH